MSEGTPGRSDAGVKITYCTGTTSSETNEEHHVRCCKPVLVPNLI